MVVAAVAVVKTPTVAVMVLVAAVVERDSLDSTSSDSAFIVLDANDLLPALSWRFDDFFYRRHDCKGVNLNGDDCDGEKKVIRLPSQERAQGLASRSSPIMSLE